MVGPKRALFILGAVVCLGCSGLSTLFVQNSTSKPVQMRVSFSEDRRTPYQWSQEVRPGESVEAARFYVELPKDLKIVADGQEFSYPENSLPAEIQQTGSGGKNIEWRYDGRTGTFSTSRVSNMDQWAGTMLLSLCIIAVLAFGQLLVARSSRSKPPPKG